MGSKSKHANTLPKHLRNRLRGSATPLATLSTLRNNLPSKSYPSLLAWSSQFARSGQTLLTPSFPTTLTSLVQRARLLEPTSLDKEMMWAGFRLLAHAEKLNEFVRIRDEIESTLLWQPAGDSEGLLRKFTESFGVSLFLVETSIGQLQHSRGLEAQKSYAASIRTAVRPREVLQFVVYYLSQKLEPATDPIAFRGRLDQLIEFLQVSPDTKTYLRYRLLGRLGPSPGDLATVLRWDGTSSLIDLYETFISVSLNAIHRGIDVSSAMELLQQHISDHRVNRMLAYQKETHYLGLGSYDSDYLRAASVVDRGNPALALDYLQKSTTLLKDPARLLTQAQASADLGDEADPTPVPTISNQLSRLLYSIINKSGDYSLSFLDILRIVGAFRFYSFSYIVERAALSAATPEITAEPLDLLSCFIRSSFLNASALQIVPLKLVENLRLELETHGLSSESVVDALRSCGRLPAPASTDYPGSQDYGAWISLIDQSFAFSDFSLTLDLIKSLPDHTPVRLCRAVLRTKIYCYLQLSQIPAALSTISDSYLDDPPILQMLPINSCMEQINDEEASALSTDISMPIVCDLYLRYVGDDRPYLRTDSYEDFLFAHGCRRPSDLSQIIDQFERKKVVYYLRYVCVMDVMLHSGAFLSSKDLEDERLQICALLRVIDPDNAQSYDQEVRDITRKQIVHQGLRQVEQSKFSIDTQPFHRWADKNLKEGFTRYQALNEAGVQMAVTSTATTAGSAAPQGLEVPLNESIDLLNQMLSSFLWETFTNSYYGLDSYISMRARHGSLMGQLRAPLEEETIITQRDAGSDGYKSNDYWIGRLHSDQDTMRRIDSYLKEFSRKYDETVKNFADQRLQIASKEKPDGLFSFSVELFDLEIVALQIGLETTLDAFVELCFDVFWGNVEDSLQRVRVDIDTHLKAELNSLLENLVGSLERERHSTYYIEDLITGIRASETRLQQSLEGLKSWFQMPKTLPPRVFYMDEVIDISLQQVKRLHPEFAPVVACDVVREQQWVDLTRLSDIFFIIFENVQRHSHVGNHPGINVHASLQAKTMTLVVSSEVDVSAVSAGTHDILESIRSIISAGQYQKIVRSEGGTGLVKLWNIVRSELSALEFGFDGAHFVVKLTTPFITLK